VKLPRKERKALEVLVRRGTAPQRDVVRAKIALMAHDGATNTTIAASLSMSLPSVSMWRGRVANQGVAGLREAQRPGRPRRINDVQRLQLLSLACEPAEARGRATPTLDELCERATGRGVVEHISRSHLQRILQAAEVRPHRVRQWLHSPDPQFREKVNAICALYRQAPKGSVVLSIDEKTGIQAIERKHADRAPRPARARRQEFEYIRHGTQALTAALDVHSGRVLARCTDRRTQDDLVAFMEEVARAHPKGRVHVVWDNLNTHRAYGVWKNFNAPARQLGQSDRVAVCHLRAPCAAPRQPHLHRAFASAHPGLHRPAQSLAQALQMDVRRLRVANWRAQEVRPPCPHPSPKYTPLNSKAIWPNSPGTTTPACAPTASTC
jgi:transposase